MESKVTNAIDAVLAGITYFAENVQHQNVRDDCAMLDALGRTLNTLITVQEQHESQAAHRGEVVIIDPQTGERTR